MDMGPFFFIQPNPTHSVITHLSEMQTLGWRRGVVVSGVRRMNEVNAQCTSGPVSTVFGRVYHLGM